MKIKVMTTMFVLCFAWAGISVACFAAGPEDCKLETANGPVMGRLNKKAGVCVYKGICRAPGWRSALCAAPARCTLDTSAQSRKIW